MYIRYVIACDLDVHLCNINNFAEMHIHSRFLTSSSSHKTWQTRQNYRKINMETAVSEATERTGGVRERESRECESVSNNETFDVDSWHMQMRGGRIVVIVAGRPCRRAAAAVCSVLFVI